VKRRRLAELQDNGPEDKPELKEGGEAGEDQNNEQGGDKGDDEEEEEETEDGTSQETSQTESDYEEITARFPTVVIPETPSPQATDDSLSSYEEMKFRPNLEKWEPQGTRSPSENLGSEPGSPSGALEPGSGSETETGEFVFISRRQRAMNMTPWGGSKPLPAQQSQPASEESGELPAEETSPAPDNSPTQPAPDHESPVSGDAQPRPDWGGSLQQDASHAPSEESQMVPPAQLAPDSQPDDSPTVSTQLAAPDNDESPVSGDTQPFTQSN
jgi:hypothetical protein